MRARRGAGHHTHARAVRGRRHGMRQCRCVLLGYLQRRIVQPRAVRGRGDSLRTPRGLLLVPVPAGRQRATGLRVRLGLRQRRPCLQSRRRMLRTRLHQRRHLRRESMRAGKGRVRDRERLLLGRLHGRQVRSPGAWLSRGRRDLRDRRRLLRRPMRPHRRGRDRLPSRWRLSCGRRDLQQRNRLLFGSLPGDAERGRHLQSSARLQSHRRALDRCQELLLGRVRRRRSLPRRGRMLCQGRTLSIKRRLLLGNLPKRTRRRAPMRRHTGVQVHLTGVQRARQVLRSRRCLRRDRALFGSRRVPKGRPPLCPGRRLLLRRLRAEHLGQARLSRHLCARWCALHGRSGLLLGKLLRFSRALPAGVVGSTFSQTSLPCIA